MKTLMIVVVLSALAACTGYGSGSSQGRDNPGGYTQGRGGNGGGGY